MEPSGKKKNWKLRLGIIILIVSFATTPMILATPFLKIDNKLKIAITTGLIIVGNITFYSGGFLVGKELFSKYKSLMNPKNWFKKKKASKED